MKTATRGFLRKFALLSSRTSDDAQRLTEPSEIRMKFIFFFLALSTLAVIFLPSLLQLINPANVVSPEIIFPPRSWHMVYESSKAPCPYDATGAAKDCFANPANPLLWTSPSLRTDSAHSSKVDSRRYNDFWLGIEIPSELLERAYSIEANKIMLGAFNSSYRIWLDGRYITGTQGWAELESIVIPVPMARLHERTPIKIAIQVIHDLGHGEPDLLNRYFGGEGFMTTARVNAAKLLVDFWSRARPFSLALAYGIMALVFFIFWFPSKVKQEYFYISMLTLVCSFHQARSMSTFFTAVSPLSYMGATICLDFYQGVFGMFLGLSFARARLPLFRYGIPVLIAVPLVLVQILSTTASRQVAEEALRSWGISGFYTVGALSCLIQALTLWSQSSMRTRRNRLLLFFLGLSLLGFASSMFGTMLWSTKYRSWMGVELFALLIFLSSIALREYREQIHQVSRAPVSEYHRREILPEKLPGAIIMANYKDPAGMSSRKARTENENALNVWRSHFYTAVLRAGGTVIHKKGEEVIAFFDASRCPSPEVAALAALREVEAASRLMDIEFNRRRQAFCFRAALVVGAIRPVWEEVAGRREAYWEEAGDTTPFVECSRLLEAEYALFSQLSLEQTRKTESSVVFCKHDLALGLVEQVPALQQSFLDFIGKVKDKHGNDYSISIYIPKPISSESVSYLSAAAA